MCSTKNANEVESWLEIWKKTVDVQQHFNDLELRIRNYALIVVGALLGLGGYALKEAIRIQLFGVTFSASGLIILLSAIPLVAFYFMDRFWYHKLLEGSVQAGAKAEQELQRLGYEVCLGSEISKASPISWRLWGKKSSDAPWYKFPQRKMHTRHKMDFFYVSLVLVLGIVGTILLFTSTPSETARPLTVSSLQDSSPTPSKKRCLQKTPAYNLDSATNTTTIHRQIIINNSKLTPRPNITFPTVLINATRQGTYL